MKQLIGSYQIDAVTRDEAKEDLNSVMGHHLSQALIERYRGVKALKIPVVAGTAGGTTLTLPVNSTDPVQAGPQQGYFWRIGRVTVASTGTDAGAVALYAGSDPANLSGQFLVDNTLKVGQAYYPGTRGLFLWPGEVLYVVITSVSGNTYRLSGVAVETPAEMAAKILAGG